MAGEALTEAFGEAFVRSPPKDLLPLALAAALAGSEENRGEARATEPAQLASPVDVSPATNAVASSSAARAAAREPLSATAISSERPERLAATERERAEASPTESGEPISSSAAQALLSHASVLASSAEPVEASTASTAETADTVPSSRTVVLSAHVVLCSSCAWAAPSSSLVETREYASLPTHGRHCIACPHHAIAAQQQCQQLCAETPRRRP